MDIILIQPSSTARERLIYRPKHSHSFRVGEVSPLGLVLRVQPCKLHSYFPYKAMTIDNMAGSRRPVSTVWTWAQS